MREILTKRTIIIFSTALLLAIISIVSVNVFGNSGPVTGVMNIVTRPVRVLASTVASAFRDIFRANYEYQQLQAENDELRRQIAVREADYRESQDIAAENDRLRRLLEFTGRHSGYEQEMATITGRGSDNWTSTFVINLGSTNSNIAVGNGVTTEFGTLVGQVYDIGLVSSTVITVLDTRFQAAVYVSQSDTGNDTGTSIVARGDFSYMGSGMLVLNIIDDDVVVRNDDYVVTSGAGGIFPPNLIIGEVVDVRRNDSGIGMFAPVIPNANIDSINTVFVITSFEYTG